MGDHGLAIMALRNELALETELVSDVAPLNALVRRALDVRCLLHRDGHPTATVWTALNCPPKHLRPSGHPSI